LRKPKQQPPNQTIDLFQPRTSEQKHDDLIAIIFGNLSYFTTRYFNPETAIAEIRDDLTKYNQTGDNYDTYTDEEINNAFTEALNIFIPYSIQIAEKTNDPKIINQVLYRAERLLDTNEKLYATA
jgi:hypothetical protein